MNLEQNWSRALDPVETGSEVCSRTGNPIGPCWPGSLGWSLKPRRHPRWAVGFSPGIGGVCACSGLVDCGACQLWSVLSLTGPVWFGLERASNTRDVTDLVAPTFVSLTWSVPRSGIVTGRAVDECRSMASVAGSSPGREYQRMGTGPTREFMLATWSSSRLSGCLHQGDHAKHVRRSASLTCCPQGLDRTPRLGQSLGGQG